MEREEASEWIELTIVGVRGILVVPSVPRMKRIWLRGSKGTSPGPGGGCWVVLVDDILDNFFVVCGGWKMVNERSLLMKGMTVADDGFQSPRAMWSVRC